MTACQVRRLFPPSLSLLGNVNSSIPTDLTISLLLLVCHHGYGAKHSVAHHSNFCSRNGQWSIHAMPWGNILVNPTILKSDFVTPTSQA